MDNKIKYTAFFFIAVITFASYFLGPCHYLKPQQLILIGTATYAYDDQSVRSDDHSNINDWLQRNSYGWKWDFENYPQNATIDSHKLRITVYRNRVIIKKKFPPHRQYSKRGDGYVVLRIITNKINE